MPTILSPTSGRELDEKSYFDTAQLAAILKKKPQTLRKEFCIRGHAYGLVPQKIGNRLLWRAEEVRGLLGRY